MLFPFSQLLYRASKRLPAAAYLRPQIAGLGDAARHHAQGKRPGTGFAPFEFIPSAWRRHRSAGLGAHGVGRRERRAVRISPGVDEDAPTTVDLAEFLCEVAWIAAHERRTNRLCEPPDFAEAGGGVEWYDDMESLRTRCLDPACQA